MKRKLPGKTKMTAKRAAELVAAERERCAKLVPTNWCDSLLTGDGVAKPPLDGRGIEALLRGVQDRIRNSRYGPYAHGGWNAETDQSGVETMAAGAWVACCSRISRRAGLEPAK